MIAFDVTKRSGRCSQCCACRRGGRRRACRCGAPCARSRGGRDVVGAPASEWAGEGAELLLGEDGDGGVGDRSMARSWTRRGSTSSWARGRARGAGRDAATARSRSQRRGWPWRGRGYELGEVQRRGAPGLLVRSTRHGRGRHSRCGVHAQRRRGTGVGSGRRGRWARATRRRGWTSGQGLRGARLGGRQQLREARNGAEGGGGHGFYSVVP